MPLIFACTKEEPFVEGEEIVLNMSVCADGIQTIATRAMGDNVVGTPALWLVVFDSNGQLVEWAKAYDFTQSTPEGKETITYFKARLHATLEGRIMHLLLNYVDDDEVLDFDYGHENNIIGGLIVERDRDVYWQRVVLPNGINNDNTVSNYLTKVPLVRNFSKITVKVDDRIKDKFSISGFYVLNVPKYGTVAPFHDGEFVKYHKEDANFDGLTTFTTKSYQQLDVEEGYRGTIPNVDDERIQKASDFKEADLLTPSDSYYLYENRYISGDKDRTVSVLLKGRYEGEEYWYRVDLVKKNPTTGVLEYFDVLRNFSYNIKITQAAVGKTSVNDAINHAAGNNVLSSLDIAHLTEISDGHALLEVNHTDTVLISHDVVYVRYKFTDDGSDDFIENTNEDIANKAENDDCGWYLTYKGVVSPTNAPINVVFADNDDSDGWRTVTVTVNQNALKEREEVSLTFIVTSSTGEILSRTVDYTLLHQQKMLVECPSKVPGVVGSEVNVSILIPDGLPEAMFPLDFAIEAQGTNQSGNEKTYLAQHISPHKNEVMTVKTAGSIVPTFAGKKSFQYMVTFSYEDYLNATLTTRQLEAGGQNVPVRVFTKKFVTNIAESASRVYAYNKYFDLGSDNFVNGRSGDFVAFFSNDNTAQYGVGRTIKLNIVAGAAGTYRVESTTLQVPTRATLAELTLEADEERTIDLVTSTFADRGQITVTCGNETRTATAAERNTLNIKATSVKQGGLDLDGNTEISVYDSESNANGMINSKGTTNVTTLKGNKGYNVVMPNLQESATLFFSYISDDYHLYVSSATVNALSSGTAELNFVDKGLIVTNITDLSLSGDKYYGVGRDVTLTFNTNIAGTYTITQTEGTETATYKHTVTAVGKQTVKLKTLTWGDKLNVTVSGMNDSESVVGVTRNTIKFGQLTVRQQGWNGGYSDVNGGTDITIRINDTDIPQTVKASALSGYDQIEREGLESTDKVVFKYTAWSYGSNRTYTSSEFDLEDVVEGKQQNIDCN